MAGRAGRRVKALSGPVRHRCHRPAGGGRPSRNGTGDPGFPAGARRPAAGLLRGRGDRPQGPSFGAPPSGWNAVMRLGIDLGGTKIEIVGLTADGSVTLRRRIAPPRDYESMLRAVAELVRDAE